MAVTRIQSDSDDGSPPNIVEGSADDIEDDEQMQAGAEEVDEGAELEEDGVRLNKVADILKRRGLGALAKRLHHDAADLVRAGHQAIEHGEGMIMRAEDSHRAHQVASLVLTEPQQLAAWQAPIKTITRAIDRWVPESVFIEAAGGDEVVGHQRREDALRLGDWLTRLEAGVAQTTEEALKIGVGIVTFIADVETILDHIPSPVKHTIIAALQTLFALLPFFH